MAVAPAAAGAAPDASGAACTAGKCHAALGALIAAARIQHAPVAARACLSCHVAHDASAPPRRRLAQAQPDLCYSCHTEFARRVRRATHQHTPVREGRCTACHGPHGADGVELLTKWRPLSEYEWMRYGGSTDILFCTGCHDLAIVTKRETDTLTRFRDGTRNLHALHLLGKKGRPCKACHDTHAADQEYHVRPDVPFGTGGWSLPIAFTKTATGGGCVVGCHRPAAYDRERAAGHGPNRQDWPAIPDAVERNTAR